MKQKIEYRLRTHKAGPRLYVSYVERYIDGQFELVASYERHLTRSRAYRYARSMRDGFTEAYRKYEAAQCRTEQKN
jgi:hypothetical protein